MFKVKCKDFVHSKFACFLSSLKIQQWKFSWMPQHDQQFNFHFPKEYSHAPQMSLVGYLALATDSCSLSRISYAYLTWVAMWARFFRQQGNIEITRSCMHWYVRKIESIIGVQWGKKKSQPEGQTFEWETRLAEFPTERWTRELGFFWNHWTPMIDSFSHIPQPYRKVL